MKYAIVVIMMMIILVGCSKNSSEPPSDGNETHPTGPEGILSTLSAEIGSAEFMLHYIPPAGGSVYRLSSKIVHFAAISSYHNVAAFSDNYDIFICSPDDSASVRRMTTDSLDMIDVYPTFIAESTLIFLRREGYNSFAVVRMDISSMIMDTVWTLSYAIKELKGSPSGQYIAYARQAVGSSVYVNRVSDGSSVSLPVGGEAEDFAWAHNSDKLLVSEDDTIYIVDVETETSTTIPITEGNGSFVAFSPSDSLIAYAIRFNSGTSEYSNIYLAPADGDTSYLLVDNSGGTLWLLGLAFSKNGDKIAYSYRLPDWICSISAVDISSGDRMALVDNLQSVGILLWW